MKQFNFTRTLLLLAFMAFTPRLGAQTHPLTFGATLSTVTNWYQDYVGTRLTVTAPAVIAGEKVNAPASVGTSPGFWPDIVFTPLFNVPIVMDGAADSFGATPFGYSMSGKIAVLWRGPLTSVVQFAQKAINAQNAGAVACIIINNVPGAAPFIPGYVAGFGTITIPVVMISNSDGIAISAQYHSLPAGTVKMSLTTWGQNNANDLGMVPDGAAGWHSYAIPSNQLFSSGYPDAYKGLDGAFIANYGTHDATHVKVSDTLRYTPSGGAASVIHTDVSPTLGVFHPADSIYAMVAASEYNFAPTGSGTGRFDLKYTISSDTADQYTADNSATYSFYTTDSLYSKGRYDFAANKPVSSIFYGYSSPIDFTWGPMYYVAHGGSSISSVQFSLSAGATPGPIGLSSMNLFAMKWVDGSGGQPLDGLVQNGELTNVSMGVYYFSATDSSGGTFKVQMGDPTLGTPGISVLLDSNAWYYIAAEVPAGYFLGCDGATSPYPRIYGRYHTSSTFDYSNIVWPGDYEFGTNPMTGAPAQANAPCAFPGTMYINSVDSFNYNNEKGLIPSIALIVNNNPVAPITGASSVCPGATTTLSDATAGGTWSCSAPFVATIGATTGIVTGISSGFAVISYTSPAGIAIFAISVESAPAPVSGTFSICTGATTTLTDLTFGGTWSSASANASINPTTGLLTGISAGTAVISYTDDSGCVAVVTETITPLPPAISGTSSVCIGATTSLSDAASGGTWTSGSTPTATVSGGTVTGVAAGTANITYSLGAGCIATTEVTVNSLPTPSIVVSMPTLSTSVPYATYQWKLAGTNIVGATNATYDVSVNGVYSVIVTDANGCSGASDVAIISTVGVPGVYTATEQIMVYPNPNRGSFSLSVSSLSTGPVVVTVKNVIGEEIKTFSITANTLANVQLNVPTGIYFLSATVAGERKSVKVIVQ